MVMLCTAAPERLFHLDSWDSDSGGSFSQSARVRASVWFLKRRSLGWDFRPASDPRSHRPPHQFPLGSRSQRGSSEYASARHPPSVSTQASAMLKRIPAYVLIPVPLCG